VRCHLPDKRKVIFSTRSSFERKVSFLKEGAPSFHRGVWRGVYNRNYEFPRNLPEASTQRGEDLLVYKTYRKYQPDQKKTRGRKTLETTGKGFFPRYASNGPPQTSLRGFCFKGRLLRNLNLTGADGGTLSLRTSSGRGFFSEL